MGFPPSVPLLLDQRNTAWGHQLVSAVFSLRTAPNNSVYDYDVIGNTLLLLFSYQLIRA